MPSVTAWLFLVLASVGVVEKYAGTLSVPVYAVAVFVAVRYVWNRPIELPRPRWIAVAAVALLMSTFAVVYPIADSGVFGGGTDRDDALNVAAEALMRGEFPYRERTYLDNPVTPMPGAVLLALPFVALGNSAWQVLFWIPVFLWVAARWLGSLSTALVLLGSVLLLSPTVMRSVVTGGDLLTNSLYASSFVLLLLEASRRRRAGSAAVWSVLLGVGLASRPNLALLVPFLFAHLRQHADGRWALAHTGLVCAASAAVVLPFLLYSPAEFSPLHFGARLWSSIPYTQVAVPAAVALLTLVLACRRTDPFGFDVMRRFGIVGLFFVACLHVLRSADAGQLVLQIDDVGTLFVVFGVFGAGLPRPVS